MPLQETAGQKLERFLKRAGMQQKELASRIGAEPSYISRLVTDRVNWVTSKYFGLIASELRLTDEEIKELNPAAVVEPPKLDPLVERILESMARLTLEEVLRDFAPLIAELSTRNRAALKESLQQFLADQPEMEVRENEDGTLTALNFTQRSLNFDPNQSAIDLVRMGGEPVNDEYPIPILGDVAAGGRNDTFIDIENADEFIDAGRELAQRFGISNLYGLKVNGDSMYSEKVRFSVPNGSTLIVHRELEPMRGMLVVAYIEDLDLGVVKEFGEPDDVTLSSYNPRGPIYRANEHRIRICGVVVEVRYRPYLNMMNGQH